MLLLLLPLLLSIPSPVAAAQQHLLTACMMHVARRRQAQFQLQSPRMLHLYGRSVCLFVCPASAASAPTPTPATTALSFAASESESEPHTACQFVVCIVCSFAHSMPLLLLRSAAPLFVCFLKLQSFYTLHHGKHDPYFWQAAERALSPSLSLPQSSRCCSGCLKKLIWLRIFH